MYYSIMFKIKLFLLLEDYECVQYFDRDSQKYLEKENLDLHSFFCMTKILEVCEMLFRIHFKKLRHRRLGLISCDERVQLNMNERQLCVEER